MPTPQEIEAAAGIQPADEVERKRIWGAAAAMASDEQRAPSAADLQRAEALLNAAAAAEAEHLELGHGRAVITLTDGSGDEGEVEVALAFTPELEHRARHAEHDVPADPRPRAAAEHRARRRADRVAASAPP